MDRGRGEDPSAPRRPSASHPTWHLATQIKLLNKAANTYTNKVQIQIQDMSNPPPSLGQSPYLASTLPPSNPDKANKKCQIRTIQ